MGTSNSPTSLSLLLVLVVVVVEFFHGGLCGVTYDRKALIIKGQRRIIISGSIHYPRSTPDMWEGLVQKAKDGGLDCIETYVFWNGHEPSPGKYNFEGRYDLVRFLKTVQKAGLYAHLRIGPYVCAEWNFGGFPVWLKYVPGISFRTDNKPFKAEMQRFVQKIVGMMKSESLFESQGGPIILSQIENEYGPESKAFGAAGHAYTKWAASMAVGLKTGVPWVMCKQEDAPDPVINTCNGFYCDSFRPNKPNKPTMWTEAWSGWFTEFGGAVHKRPAEDLAFAVARFIQEGGSFVNYYMYHGGTNFGRTAGGPFITTSYDYDAPIDEYGLAREPKYSHLKELHRTIKLCEKALISSDPAITSLGRYEQAHVYSTEDGDCAAFLSNFNKDSHSRVMFNNRHHTLPPWSISILPDCKAVAFNTAKVGVQTSRMQMLPSGAKPLYWKGFVEEVVSSEEASMISTVGLLEQINVTRDTSDYLWYITSVDISPSESFLNGGKAPVLTVMSAGHALHVFINGELSGSAYGTRRDKRITYNGNANLRSGLNKIALLSVAMGLPNVGTHYETWNTGVMGPVALHGLKEGSRHLTWQRWFYKVGLRGESMNINSLEGTSSVEWMRGSLVMNKQRPLSWFKSYFDAPNGDEPLALDMSSMGKGQIWINGKSIGRYWMASSSDECKECSYVGTYRPPKCQTGCGEPTQRWYHVPRSWLHPTGNLLVVFEEIGGDASKISLVKRSMSSICADISEWHPLRENWELDGYGHSKEVHRPRMHLRCASGQSITAIKFASFGTPSGACGNFKLGQCHFADSHTVIAEKCVGKRRCAVTVSPANFGGDPCPNVLKRVAVEAVCSPMREEMVP